MPTQTAPENLSAAVANDTAAKARDRLLKRAAGDAKAAYDDVRAASIKGMDGSVRADLLTQAKQRLELALSALKQIG